MGALAATGGQWIATTKTSAAHTVSSDWEKQRRKLAHRQRRIIFNDDGDARSDEWYRRSSATYGSDLKSVKDFLARRFDRTIDTQVDSFFWCVGDGQEPPHGMPTAEVIGDVNRIMLSAARKAGQEAVFSLRMNDIHDAFGPFTYPFKQQNRHVLMDPDGYNGKYTRSDVRHWTWSAMDYAFPEVRQHKLAYISEICEKYLPDGFELDFFRHNIYFKPGQEKRNIPVMTDFVRQVRHRLDTIGQKHGRPILLIARSPDTPQESIELGLDCPTWIKEGLLDVLIIGGGFTPYYTAWTEYRDLAHQHDVPAYPCYDCSLLYHHFQNIEALQALRGAATNYWHHKAEGIYLFNLYVPVDGGMISAETAYSSLNHIGNPKSLVGLDKIYCQDYVRDKHLLMGTADRPLPMAIDDTLRSIPLPVGEDMSKIVTGKQRHCRLFLSADPPSTELIVKLNGSDLGHRQVGADHWQEFEVQSQTVRQGDNDLSVAVRSGEKARLIRTYLSIMYR